MDVSKEKILIISSKFPPNASVGCLRVYNFAHQATRHFQKVHVICPKNPVICLKEAFPKIDIVRHPISNIDYRFFRKKHKGNGSNPNLIMSRLANSFPLNIWIGESALSFKRTSLTLAEELIKKEKIRFVFSSFRPFSDHHVCYQLKKTFPELIWIADFRDYHFSNIGLQFWPKIQENWKRKILKRADLISSVSKAISREFSIYSKYSFTLRNGIGHQFHQEDNQEEPTKFRILYSGSIYPEYQKIDSFITAIKALIETESIFHDQIEFVYCGPHASYFRKIFEAKELLDIFHDAGNLSFQKANQLQENAHINLLLSWNFPDREGILTAKLYDYLASGRPILALVNGSRAEELEEILSDYDKGAIYYHNSEAIKGISSYILDIYLYWLKERTYPMKTPFDETYKRFGWENNFKEFVKCLESLMNTDDERN